MRDDIYLAETRHNAAEQQALNGMGLLIGKRCFLHQLARP